MPQNPITLTEDDAQFVLRCVSHVESGDDARRAVHLLTYGSDGGPAGGYPMADRCACNQGDEVRVNFHRRGDLRWCRDVFEAGIRA